MTAFKPRPDEPTTHVELFTGVVGRRLIVSDGADGIGFRTEIYDTEKDAVLLSAEVYMFGGQVRELIERMTEIADRRGL